MLSCKNSAALRRRPMPGEGEHEDVYEECV